MLSNNQKEFTSSIFFTIIEVYKVFVATLLSVFVPQLCPETNTTCTLKENFTNLTHFNSFVVAFNFFTLFVFSWLYKIQTRRETYFITHLEINKSVPLDNLKNIINQYDKINRRVIFHNFSLYKISLLALITYTINLILSAVLIFYFYYDGFRSVTVLLTNIILISSKIYSCIDISYTCRKELSAISLTKSSNVYYNDIDPKYISRKSVERIELENTT